MGAVAWWAIKQQPDLRWNMINRKITFVIKTGQNET